MQPPLSPVAITLGQDSPPDWPLIEGYHHDDLTLWYAPALPQEGAGPALTKAAHHKTVCELAQHYSSVLPLRYGTQLDGPDALSRLMEDHGEAFKTRLEWLDQCVEYTLITPLETGPAPKAMSPWASGRKYLRERARASRLIKQQIAQLDADLEELEGLKSWTPPVQAQSASAALETHLLVPHPHNAGLEAFAKAHKAQLMGPWPPYSFCDGIVSDEP